MASKEMRVVLLQIFFALPSCLLFGVVIPLNLAQLDRLGAGNSLGSLKDLHRFLLISQVTLQPNSIKWNGVSQNNIDHLRVTLLQLGYVEHIVNSRQGFRQLQLVNYLSSALQDLVRSHK